MKKIVICLALLSTLVAASCRKTCECKRYDGGIDTYEIDDLNAEGKTCSDMEQLYYGRLYISCSRVF